MSDNELSWFRESFKDIKDALGEMNLKLDKKADYLQSRAEANFTEIEKLKGYVNVRVEGIKKMEDDINILTDRVDSLEICGENTVKKSECSSTRRECREGQQKRVDSSRNWILFAFAAAQLIFAAVLLFDKLA
jgi:predicted nuclease with TOPRIM domain